MPGYPYNMDSNYGGVPLVQEEKMKEDRVKKTPSPIIDQMVNKQPAPIPNPIQVPTPGKVKEVNLKDKHQNENHQILKESIEIKNQMNPYMYSRQSQQQQQPHQQPSPQQQQSHHNSRKKMCAGFTCIQIRGGKNSSRWLIIRPAALHLVK